MHVNIYLTTTVKGPRRSDGEGGYILEAVYPGKDPATASVFYPVRGCNWAESTMLILKSALQRMRVPSEITIYLDNEYVGSVIKNGWLRKWEKDGWKNAKGETIKNSEDWKEILYLLNEYCPEPEVIVRAKHSYKQWMEDEAQKRLKEKNDV